MNDYAPGTTKFNNIAKAYGTAAANEAHRIASNGGDSADVTLALNKYRKQVDICSQSTLGNFWDQITTDPLGAPLQSANNTIGNTVKSFFKNPWVLLAIAVLVWGWLGFPGLNSIKKKFA